MSSSNQMLWSQFSAGIAAKMGSGASVASIQVLPSAQLLEGKSAIDLANSISEFSAVIPQWGSTYNPSSSSVIDAYQVILTQAQETATNGKEIKAQYEKENAVLAEEMGKASSYKTGKITAYLKAIAIYKQAKITPPTFEAWFKDNGLQEYVSLLANQTAQTAKVKQLLVASGISSPLIGALSRLNNEIEALKNQISPPLTLNPQASLLAGWKTQPTNPGGISFDNSSAQYDYSKTIWKEQSGVELFGFISIGHRNKSKTQENIISSTMNYSVDLEFDAQASIIVTQGNWFNGALLKEYKNGPWIPKSQFASKKGHPFGDNSAVFPLLITKLYIVMNPSISITLDTKDYKSVYKNLQNNLANGISLGPFGFGGSNNSNSSAICQVSAVQNSQTLTVRDTSNVPQIIAVANQLMP